jgi:hypothetical protein
MQAAATIIIMHCIIGCLPDYAFVAGLMRHMQCMQESAAASSCTGSASAAAVVNPAASNGFKVVPQHCLLEGVVMQWQAPCQRSTVMACELWPAGAALFLLRGNACAELVDHGVAVLCSVLQCNRQS